MVLYRITKCIYADDLSGSGGRLYGGRWHSEGLPAIYAASSRSLAVLEVLVHLQPLTIPNDFCLVELEIPDNDIAHLETEELPVNWKDISPPAILRQFGNDFLKAQKHLALQVPSAIVQSEYNYLLNPLHKDMRKVKILKKESFNFDERLVH